MLAAAETVGDPEAAIGIKATAEAGTTAAKKAGVVVLHLGAEEATKEAREAVEAGVATNGAMAATSGATNPKEAGVEHPHQLAGLEALQPGVVQPEARAPEEAMAEAGAIAAPQADMEPALLWPEATTKAGDLVAGL